MVAFKFKPEYTTEALEKLFHEELRLGNRMPALV